MTGFEGVLQQCRHVLQQRFSRFLLVGLAAAVVNIVSRVVISSFVRFEYAVALAFPIALTFAFVATRLLVFERSDRSVWQQYFRFFLVNVVALAQVWLVSVGLSDWAFPKIGMTWHAELAAHTIGVLSPVATSYLGHKHFTFG